MRQTADVVIIGGGISGAASAYYLAKKGVRNIVLLERGYITGGATGRCGAGIRQQWGTEMNCLIAKHSCEVFEHAQEELEYPHDIEFKQGGYLLLASTERELEQFRKNVALQNSLDIQSRLLTLQEAQEIVPILHTEGLTGAAYHHKDGHLNPFHATMAYIQAARRLGVDVETYTEVLDIEVEQGRIQKVCTSRGDIAAPVVVNAAGGWSQQVAAMAGVDLPLYSKRHEILVTEPVDPILEPMVISFSLNFYCQQVPHGGLVMGMGDDNAPRDLRQTSSWQFLEEVLTRVTRVLPPLKDVRVLRQWAGLYNMSPDRQPIYGPVDEVAGLYIAAGFSGHGFMFGPSTGLIIAEYILGEELTLPVKPLILNRFKEGRLIIEPSVV
jgi:sarcosine oxidase, subunit beta